MKKKWYKTWWGILAIILLFPIFLLGYATHWIWKQKWDLKARIGLIAVMWGIILIFGLVQDAKTPTVSTTQQAINTTSNAVSTKEPDPTATESKSVTEKINNLMAEKYSNFEVTIWNKDKDFASEGQTPYEVILNGSLNKPIASSCNDAKRLSYYMLEELYKDNEIRLTLSRVMITIPNYLRVSLGSSDGVPMTDSGNFSGPTNFWTVMEKMGLGENENGDMQNRTWGVYLARCK